MSQVDALEPRILRSFVAVAEELHFGRAARRLHISQPPLSVQIRKLEEQLGVRLFERDRRHVALTEAGGFFLDRAKHLLAEAERSCAEAIRIAHGEAGILTVGYTSTATYEVLPKLLTGLAKTHPAVRLELLELGSTLQGEALRSGRIEVGLACGPLEEPGLGVKVLAKERFVAVLPKKHPLARKKSLKVRDLDGEPFVSVRPDIEPAWADRCAKALARAGVRVEVAQETDTKIALLGLVAAGIGVSVVSASMQRLARENVVFRELPDFSLQLPLVALFREPTSPRARALLSFA